MHLWNTVSNQLTLINMDEVLTIDIHICDFPGYTPGPISRFFGIKPVPPKISYTAFINFKGKNWGLTLEGEAAEAFYEKMVGLRNDENPSAYTGLVRVNNQQF